MPKFLRLFEQLLFVLVLFILFFVPLYPKFPLVNIPGTFVAIRIEDLVIAGVLGLWGIYLMFSKQWRELIKQPLFQAMLLFFAIGLVSLFSAYFVSHTIKPHLALFHWLRRVELMMLLPVAYSVLRSKRQIYFSLIMLSIVLVLVNLYALGQQFLHWPLVSTTNSEFAKGQILYLTPDARVNSTFAGHYDLAVFLVMALSVITAVFFAVKSWWWRLWMSVLGLLSFGVLVMTAARLSFVAAVVGIATSLWLIGKKKFLLVLVVLAIVAVAAPTQLRERLISTFEVNIQKKGDRFVGQTEEQRRRGALNIPNLPVKISSKSATPVDSTSGATIASDIAPGEPVDSTELGVYRSFQIRLNVEWPAALRAFYKNPLLGSGYSTLGIATDNDILRSLAEVGILGTLAFGLILWALWKRLYRIFKESPKVLKYLTAGSLAMMVAFIVNAIFIDVFEASKVATLFWLWLGINLSFERLRSLSSR